MNISQMMRGLLGEAVAGETRTMELRTGQIVRGVVMQVMENNEALVNINGVQVRARLEMPMQAGQSALLQVQPESNGSLIVLKGAETGSPVLMEDTLKEFTKQLGLPDQRWAMELVKDLRKDGFPFNRATSDAFHQAAAAMPHGANQEQWMNAAAAAFKRGLPMTTATIAAVGQTMHGASVHALLDGLQKQLAALLQGTGGEAVSPETRLGAECLLRLLQVGEGLLQNGTSGGKDAGGTATANASPGSSAGVAGPQGQAAATAQTVAGTAAGQQPGGLPGNTAGSQTGGQAAIQTMPGSPAAASAPVAGQPATGNAPAASAAGSMAASSATTAPAGEGQTQAQATANQAGTTGQNHSAATASTNWLGQMMKWLGVDHELQLARAASGGDNGAASGAAKGEASGQPSAQAGSSAQQTAPQAAQNNPTQPTQGAGSQSAAQTQAPAASGAPQHGNAGVNMQDSRAGDPAASAQARAAGQGEAPHQAANSAAAARTAGTAGAQASVPALQADLASNSSAPAPAVNGGATAAPAAAPIQDSLKSALMSLVSGNDVPPAVKETIQSLIHQITGQQLLLSPERNSSLFTHVTMFIPLKDQDGGGTASVHIQTRRGRKGELDANNCRLLFNLSMKVLGDTLVDVQITDKIVSLNLWNDHPAISGLLETSRGEMSERLLGAGYQLLSLRSSPFPAQVEAASTMPEPAASKRQAPPDISQFSSTRYKGVDFRV
ncbi:hypothetical protein A7K91_02565 [Paenibacillus oryzae]|uniref:Flagellar hook-length control protein-like C-terminal domain-containing protein n=1 Tax=Paenibacillus oryzae TaxID=1844972 RepID=A0A1A5YVG1_9BACL|nr:hypothetical protein [Paenibacillus oryzae]OBR69617.1 hypothetical protein A7K91_02565 [Paenibacillus oryzae]